LCNTEITAIIIGDGKLDRRRAKAGAVREEERKAVGDGREAYSDRQHATCDRGVNFIYFFRL
jgi:hypothetical protein